MIETQIIGHLAHDNKLSDVQCTNCYMMYDGKTLTNRTACPKCGSPLDFLRCKEGRTMAISEGTIYPTLTEREKSQDTENVSKRKNAMPIMYRFVLFSFGNTDTGILQEPPIHQYLATGREIMIKTTHNPIASWYKSKDGSIKLELRYVITHVKGDKIQLLGRKEVAEKPTAQPVGQAGAYPGVVVNDTRPDTKPAAEVVPQPDPIDIQAVLANIQVQLNTVAAMQNAANIPTAGQKLAPSPGEVEAQETLFPTDDDEPPF